jgi:diguanylate cyclase (GGDEF)-like protein/PAS domain S-box-containing protein
LRKRILYHVASAGVVLALGVSFVLWAAWPAPGGVILSLWGPPAAVGLCAILAARFLLARTHMRAESQLRSHRDALELSVSERTRELEEVNRELKREVAQRREAEAALCHSMSFLSTILESINDPFCILDRDFTLVRVNKAYAALKRASPAEMLGGRCYAFTPFKDGPCPDCIVLRTFQEAVPCVAERKALVVEGPEKWLEVFTYPIKDQGGQVSHVIEHLRDITERKLVEHEKAALIEELEHLSRTDALTGLLNRRALIERLSQELSRASRFGSMLSVVLCDVDSFKAINDAYGHDAGDRVLCTVADTLSGLLRQADVAGRYGGDEFMVILPETDLRGALNFAEKVRKAMERAHTRLDDGVAVEASLSIGVSACGPGARSVAGLIKPADDALYASKYAGKNTVTASDGSPS